MVYAALVYLEGLMTLPETERVAVGNDWTADECSAVIALIEGEIARAEQQKVNLRNALFTRRNLIEQNDARLNELLRLLRALEVRDVGSLRKNRADFVEFVA